MGDVRVLWGKSDADGRPYPLLAHMVDAGMVARAILRSPQHRRLLALLGKLTGLDQGALDRLIPFLVGLHDIGKASPGFQRKAPDLWAQVQADGFRDTHPLWRFVAFQHDIEGFAVLRDYILADWVDRTPESASPGAKSKLVSTLAQAVGAHHGSFISEAEVCADDYPQIKQDAGGDADEVWSTARRELAELLAETFAVAGVIGLRAPSLSPLAMALNGLTIVSDWIASNEELFPPTASEVADHAAMSAAAAHRAIEQAGLLRYPAPKSGASFAALFPDLKPPRPIQVAVEGLDESGPPLLTVIEAPMGEGKTEAALLLAQRLIAETGGGFYFALPTMATSNQLFQRVREYFENGFRGEGDVGLMLVHGQAELASQIADLLAKQSISDDDAAGVVADSWFLPRKRALLAPFGVGTIDQALLAALRVRHGSLRLFGLAGKVVIVDEVHAYDAYTSTILERLIEWLAAMQVSVILLSATLTSRMRRQLTAAFGAASEVAPPKAVYPLITVARPGETVKLIEPGGCAITRVVRLESAGPDERDGILSQVVEAAAEGGAVGWVCDTVASSQGTYRELAARLKDVAADRRPEAVLYHARMLLKDRRNVEQKVERLVGKDSQRQRGCIVVATQVVEQSLDIDFDLLVSELAPIDLLFQRIGRLHRHHRRRPKGLQEPCAIVLAPEIRDGRAAWQGIDKIYEPFVLLKTLVALDGRQQLSLPADIRPLVESVYDDVAPSPDELALIGVAAHVTMNAKAELLARRQACTDAAHLFLLKSPDADRFKAETKDVPLLEDDDVEQDSIWGAQTRLAEPSVRVVLLDAGDPLLASDSVLWRKERLPSDTALCLVEHSVSISHWALVAHAVEAAPPPSFTRTGCLRGMRLLQTGQGEYRWRHEKRQFRLCVDATVGVTIEEVDREP